MQYIELTQGKQAVVDDEDYEWLSKYTWCVSNHNGTDYAVNSRLEYMHRLILDPSPGMFCDHINHDGLDNRRENVRICTRTENQQNRRPQSGFVSKFKGVYRHSVHKRWVAQIKIASKAYYCGLYKNEEDAALVYNIYAVTLFGKFAVLNEINCFKGRGV